ncbi:hypothetical protein WJX79_005659 [Trebouxia sp. C0005]
MPTDRAARKACFQRKRGAHISGQAQQQQSSGVEKQNMRAEADQRARQATGLGPNDFRKPEECTEARHGPATSQALSQDMPLALAKSEGQQLQPSTTQAEEGNDIKGSKVPLSSRPSSATPAAASAGPAHKGKHPRGSKASSKAAPPSSHAPSPGAQRSAGQAYGAPAASPEHMSAAGLAGARGPGGDTLTAANIAEALAEEVYRTEPSIIRLVS